MSTYKQWRSMIRSSLCSRQGTWILQEQPASLETVHAPAANCRLIYRPSHHLFSETGPSYMISNRYCQDCKHSFFFVSIIPHSCFKASANIWDLTIRTRTRMLTVVTRSSGPHVRGHIRRSVLMVRKTPRSWRYLVSTN